MARFAPLIHEAPVAFRRYDLRTLESLMNCDVGSLQFRLSTPM